MTFSHFKNIDALWQLLAKAICICRAQFSPPDQELLKGNPPVSVSPLYFISPPTFFYYKSMIEIVCDNRHSNWAGHNDMRARNKLNTIYKSQKWQDLQESVKEERMEGRRCACVCMCARTSMCVCVFSPQSFLWLLCSSSLNIAPLQTQYSCPIQRLL